MRVNSSEEAGFQIPKSQNPATDNQQPATNNRQPATNNQLLQRKLLMLKQLSYVFLAYL